MYALLCSINGEPRLISASNNIDTLKSIKERFINEKEIWPKEYMKLKNHDIHIKNISIYKENQRALKCGDSIYVLYSVNDDNEKHSCLKFPFKIFATFIDYQDWKINIVSSEKKIRQFLKDEIDQEFDKETTYFETYVVSYEGIQYADHIIGGIDDGMILIGDDNDNYDNDCNESDNDCDESDNEYNENDNKDNKDNCDDVFHFS